MQRDRPAIAYYITPHGFGHSVRSLEILRRLVDLEPDIEPTVVSDIPDALVEQSLGSLPNIRRLRLDVGLYQYDPIRFDLEKSLDLLSCLNSASEAIIDREVEFLRRERVRAVISDIAWLPFEAAYRCGVPSNSFPVQKSARIRHSTRAQVQWSADIIPERRRGRGCGNNQGRLWNRIGLPCPRHAHHLYGTGAVS